MERSAVEGLPLQLRILKALAGHLITWSDCGRELCGTATGQYLGAESGILAGQAQFRLKSGRAEVWAWPTAVAATGRYEATSQTVVEVLVGLAAFEEGKDLLEEVVGQMGMDRTWTADDESDILWWPSPLAQRLDFLAGREGVRLCATTNLIRVSAARLAAEGDAPIEALLSDLNYRFGSRSAWWFDEEDAVIRVSTSAVVRPGGDEFGTKRLAASAVLQAWEAMNLMSMVGDAVPELGLPYASEHPAMGTRTEADPVLRMVQRDLHEQRHPLPEPTVLGRLAALPVWSSCTAEDDHVTATPVGHTAATVRIWLEDGHPTFGAGVYFEARPRIPVLGRNVYEMAGVLNRLAVFDLSSALGGSWSVSVRKELVYRSFWPSVFSEHASLLAETAGEVIAQCTSAEQLV